jgi:two-component system, chemotaxis family, chemotaxis protein CheY
MSVVDLSIPVLVVEDMSAMGRIICGLLKQVRFRHVDVVPGGFSAVTRLKSSWYGLVISDWRMRPVSGLDLVKQIRADKGLAATRFIMMMEASSTELASAAKNAGVDGFIIKPFTALSLKNQIDRVFEENRTTTRDNYNIVIAA